MGRLFPPIFESEQTHYNEGFVMLAGTDLIPAGITCRLS